MICTRKLASKWPVQSSTLAKRTKTGTKIGQMLLDKTKTKSRNRHVMKEI